jgi:GntR family transcriptional regulator
LAEQLASLVAAGKLAPGTRLPSVRELARQLTVNQNTVLRVYERLAREGVVELRQGQGTFVVGPVLPAAPEHHRERLLEELRGLARQAQALGLSPAEVHALLDQALQQLAADSSLPSPEHAS